MLNEAKDTIQAKDREIETLEASQATKPRPSTAIDKSFSVQTARSIYNSHALRRDSEQTFVDHGPFVRPANPTLSKPLVSQTPVVEDSQPTDMSALGLVSLGDFLDDDNPFADYPQEGPDTIAGEQMSHLFPSTPGGDSRAKDFNISRHSVSHTTVVSETQQRQRHSVHKIMPHTGTHGTKTAHPQPQVGAHPKARRNSAMPRSSATTSPTNVTPRRRDTNFPSLHKEASITRDSTQPQGNVQDPRQTKRNTVAAGFNDASSQARPNKVQKTEPGKQARALGPIIKDSQSPRMNGRSRKMTRGKSSAPKG